MMKKKYETPTMEVYRIMMQQSILIGSELNDETYDASEIYDVDDII